MRSQVRFGVRLRRNAITFAVVVAGLVLLGRITGVLVDWLWFSSIGYLPVFWTVLSAKALLFVAVFAASAGTIGVSGFLAHRYARSQGPSQAGAAFLSAMPALKSELANQVAPRIPWRSGHREIHGRFAFPLSAGYSTCRQRRPDHPRTAPLFR
jgi:hypothetical protein